MIKFGTIGKHHAWELLVWHKLRHEKPYFNISWRRTGDHPGFSLFWLKKGRTILELSFYDTRHEEEINA